MAASSSRSVKRKYPVDAAPPSIMMTDGPPESLKTWWENMSGMQRDLVTEKIGFLTDLVTKKLTPHRDLISALVGFWNPDSNTFRFRGFEMTPTLEEIARFIKLDLTKTKMIAPKKVNPHYFFKNIKMVVDPSIESVSHGWISFDYLYVRFGCDNGYKRFGPEFHSTLTYVEWLQLCAKVFVFALLGLLVFPMSRKRISIKVSWIMAALYDKAPNVTIVPTILGSLFYALTRCKKGESDFFEGCNFLLQAWFLEHVRPRPPNDILRYCNTDYLSYHLEHVEKIEFPKGEHAWKSFLNSLTTDKVIWQYNWLTLKEVIHRCVDRPFLVLMGLTTAQPYAPLRVLRQLGRRQEVPVVEDMSSYVLNYFPGPFSLKGRILNLWDTRRHLGKETQVHDGLRGEVTHEYELWYRHQPIPREMPARSSTGAVDIEARLAMQVRITKHRMEKEYRATIQGLIEERDAARAAQSESEGLMHQHSDTIRRLHDLHHRALTEKDIALTAQTKSDKFVQKCLGNIHRLQDQLDQEVAAKNNALRLATIQLQQIAMSERVIDQGQRQARGLANFVAQMLLDHELSSNRTIRLEAPGYARNISQQAEALIHVLSRPLAPVEEDPEEPPEFGHE